MQHGSERRWPSESEERACSAIECLARCRATDGAPASKDTALPSFSNIKARSQADELGGCTVATRVCDLAPAKFKRGRRRRAPHANGGEDRRRQACAGTPPSLISAPSRKLASLGRATERQGGSQLLLYMSIQLSTPSGVNRPWSQHG